MPSINIVVMRVDVMFTKHNNIIEADLKQGQSKQLSHVWNHQNRGMDIMSNRLSVNLKAVLFNKSYTY